MTTIEQQHLAVLQLRDQRFDTLRIDLIRPFAHQSEQGGTVSGVADTGGRQRAIQTNLYPTDLLQQALLTQGLGKGRSRPHRAHGMGAGGPDANLEKVENTDSHANA
ncbi:hypothetical protein D3C78_1037980 [compost metagenome]